MVISWPKCAKNPQTSAIFNAKSGWWFGTFFIFPYIGLLIIPIDELIFFRGVETTNQKSSMRAKEGVGRQRMPLFCRWAKCPKQTRENEDLI